MNAFEGSYTVMLTPFTEGGAKVDLAATRRFVDWQIKEGTPGLIPLGSTGEFLSVADDERTQFIETIIDQAKGRIPVIVGTASEWSDEAVRYSKEAERLGAAGVMIIPPFYATPTDDELFEHYRRIGEAISIPIMVYNNPFTSNVDMKPALIARLGQIDNVLYVKESSGDIGRGREIERLSKGKVTVFAGYHAYDTIVCGAKGWVSVIGNIAPRLSQDLYEITSKGDLVKGRDLYHRLLPTLDAISGDLYVSATKAAMPLVGMPMGEPRPPRLPLPQDRTAGLKRALADLGVLAKKAA